MEYSSSNEGSSFINLEAADRVRKYHDMKRWINLSDDITEEQRITELIKIDEWYDKNVLGAGFTEQQIDMAIWMDSSEHEHPDIMSTFESSKQQI